MKSKNVTTPTTNTNQLQLHSLNF